VVLVEVSLSFLYHKFATASHTTILLRNPSPVCVCVCVCACGGEGGGGACVWVSVGVCRHILLDCPRLIIRHEGLF
jgi:hypothetical protein